MPYARKNHQLYRAKFRNLKVEVFGAVQILIWAPEIEVYQARVSPETWCSRPTGILHQRPWEAASAEALMAKIERCFEIVVTPWHAVEPARLPAGRPTLLSPCDRPGEKAG
jgi:hypothetical protein